jgi:dihydropteroate synthase
VKVLRCGRYTLSLERPLVMGIVNVTPDSFYDGGRHAGTDDAVAHARRLLDEGADLIDIGGESTRPGAAGVDERTELARVLPVLEALRDLDVPISVDTTKPGVMRAAIDRGASMINDVTALAAPGAIDAVADGAAAVCLMHMQGEPRTMQADPVYGDVVAEVRDFLSQRVAACRAAGIAADRIVVDPGIGFGKRLEHNLALVKHLDALAGLGLPVLVGWSRKSSLGRITGRAADDRMAASLAGALIAAQRGARILRVHDVAATRDVLAVLAAVEAA